MARQLAVLTGGIQIRSDAVRKHLAGIGLNQRGDDSLYSPEMTQKTYDRLLTLGTTLAQQGYTVILDAKYDRQGLRQTVIEAATERQIPIHILYCTAPAPVLQERIQGRVGDISDATTDVLTQQQMEPFTVAEQSIVLTLDQGDLRPSLILSHIGRA